METYEDIEEIMKVIRRITTERSEGHGETDKK